MSLSNHMSRSIHGRETKHISIAMSLHNSGTTYHEQGRLDEAQKMHLECLVVERSIRGPDTAYPSIEGFSALWDA